MIWYLLKIPACSPSNWKKMMLVTLLKASVCLSLLASVLLSVGNQDPEFMFIIPLFSFVYLLVFELSKNGFILLQLALFMHFVSSSLSIPVAICYLVGHCISIGFIYQFSYWQIFDFFISSKFQFFCYYNVAMNILMQVFWYTYARVEWNSWVLKSAK